MIKELKSFAMQHYEKGGHWVVECFEDSDYQRFLDESKGNLAKAKRELKKYWTFTEEQCQEVQDY
jgi:hypothetical protein